jgi:hypothetical protein
MLHPIWIALALLWAARLWTLRRNSRRKGNNGASVSTLVVLGSGVFCRDFVGVYDFKCTHLRTYCLVVEDGWCSVLV